MIEQEIIDGNKLIAEFMVYGEHGLWSYGDNAKERISKDAHDGTLKYHSSWDWLMPVVEKIAKLEVEKEKVVTNGNESYFDSYYPRTFAMVNAATQQFMVRINRFALHESNSLIEATFSAVVEFIKWYNENKITP